MISIFIAILALATGVYVGSIVFGHEPSDPTQAPVNYPPPKGGELLVFASTELLVHRSNKLLAE